MNYGKLALEIEIVIGLCIFVYIVWSLGHKSGWDDGLKAGLFLSQRKRKR